MIQINFINTGLDDYIVKSIQHENTNKTIKQVFVPEGPKHKAYYKEVEVNIQQPTANHAQPTANHAQPTANHNISEHWNPFIPSSEQKEYKREHGIVINVPNEVESYCRDNLKIPLKGLKVTTHNGREITIQDFNEPHFTDRFNLRFPEYIEQFINGYIAEEFKSKKIKKRYQIEKLNYFKLQLKN